MVVHSVDVTLIWCTLMASDLTRYLTAKLLQKYTAIDNGAVKGVWFKDGAMIFESDGLNYMGAPVLVRAQFIHAVLACQVVLYVPSRLTV